MSRQPNFHDLRMKTEVFFAGHETQTFFSKIEHFFLSFSDNVHRRRREILFGRTRLGLGTSAQPWHNLSRPKAGKVNIKFVPLLSNFNKFQSLLP